MRLLFGLCLFLGSVSISRAQAPEKSIVKIMVTSQAYDFSQPWQKLRPEKSSGSGCVIEGNRILTCAHVVEFGNFIEIRKEKENKKYTATIDFISPEYDLALLKVDDPHFFSNIQPLPLGDLPDVGDRVQAYGFPKGGNDLSITSGIVSRIENIEYSYNNYNSLGIQIDAAINSGNSGGPVLQDTALVGIAFQGLSSGQNIGYMIPTTVIKTFIKDIADGTYDGPIPVFLKWQKLENNVLRECYGLADSVTGILINKIHPESALINLLKPNDILLNVDGLPLQNDGSVYLNPMVKTSFIGFIQNKIACDTLSMTIFRDGKDTTLNEVLMYHNNPKILVPKVDLSPKYLIQDGFVFTTPSYYYFQNQSFWQYYYPELSAYYYGRVWTDKHQREIVIISSVLPDASNVGYHDVSNRIVSKINNYPVRDFQDLIDIFQTKADFFVIEDNEGSKYVIDGRHLSEDNEAIFKKYGISEPLRR